MPVAGYCDCNFEGPFSVVGRKYNKKNDIRKFVCHFLCIFLYILLSRAAFLSVFIYHPHAREKLLVEKQLVTSFVYNNYFFS